MSGLEQFDDDFSTAPPPLPERPALWNGVYTLTFPDGSHRTFKVWTKQEGAKFAAGRRLLGILVGPDNTSDFEPVAFVEEDRVVLWRRHRGTNIDRYVSILWAAATWGSVPPGHTLEVAKRCLRCGRDLTTPESLERGIGPECWEKLHG